MGWPEKDGLVVGLMDSVEGAAVGAHEGETVDRSECEAEGFVDLRSVGLAEGLKEISSVFVFPNGDGEAGTADRNHATNMTINEEARMLLCLENAKNSDEEDR